MNYNILAIILYIFLTKVIQVSATESIKDHKSVLNVYVESKGSAHVIYMDKKNESVRIAEGDTIIIICTTKIVHMWDGKFDLGKFDVGMRAIRWNSAGYFSSTLWVRLRESPIQDVSIPPVTQNFIKCFELENENEDAAQCLYLNTIDHTTSENPTNKSKNEEQVSVALSSCLQTITELENRETSKQAQVPEWLWNAENNSVVCHVDSPSRIQLKNIYCENPSWCNIHRFCTIHTCPSRVLAVPPCEKGCSSQSMEVNYLSGQLQCEANGLSTHLNFVKDFNSKICYFKPRGSTIACQVLDLQIPDVNVFHGFPLQLYGRASKFVIMQEPEVQIILSNGQVLRPTVYSVSDLENHKKHPYFTFMINTTANSDTKLIKVIGYRYDSNDPVVIRKQLNVKVGVLPVITGLSTQLNLPKSDKRTVLPFKTTGLPRPKFVLVFNGMILRKTDRRFNLFAHPRGYSYVQITTINGNFSGVLEISATNIFGTHSHTIVIKETLRLTRKKAYMVAGILAILLILGSAYFLSFILKTCDRFRQKPRAV